jgi:hypothetical protein
MEKLIYLLWAKEGWDQDQMRDALLKQSGPRLIELGVRALTINVNDSEADVPSPVPTPEGEQPLAAEVSLWLDCLDRRRPFEEVLEDRGLPMAGYLVTESLYTDYGGNPNGEPRTWPDGQRSPGVLTVAYFDKPERFADDEWYGHWYGTQSPISEAMQPRMRYLRNAVVRPITREAPSIRGIVDEAWPSAEHITNPMLFYGAGDSQEKLMENMGRMLESVTGFIDLDNIRNTTMSEYIMKS